MADDWYYLDNTLRQGPVDRSALDKLIATGTITGATLVWRQGLPQWTAAAEVEELRPTLARAAAPTSGPPPAGRPEPKTPARLLRNIGSKISELTDLPEIGDVPVREILFGRVFSHTEGRETEQEFIVGTRGTTPALSELEDGWPHARVCWRVLAGALGTYLLLQLGWTQFHNPNRIPAMMVVGSFVVPLAVVIFFFEMNTPRNISVYQVGKMMLFGGALGIIANAVAGQIVTGSGTGQIIPSLLTGIAEETAKAMALLLLIRKTRYRWQLNGLLFGAAVGAGFAGFESAGYAFKPVWEYAGASFDDIAELVQRNITVRGLLAPGGHVIWTAMIASGIWKVKGNRPFSIAMLADRVVVRRWLAAVILHGIWDSDLVVSFFGRLFGETTCVYAQSMVLSLAGWYIIFAILKQALSEVAAARVVEMTGSRLAPVRS